MTNPNPAAWSNSDWMSCQASYKKKHGVTESSIVNRGYHQSHFFRQWLTKTLILYSGK